MSLTFIHAADIHLDRPFLGLNGCPEPMLTRIRQSTFQALSSLVNIAINRKVDFIILAGDIFDSNDRGLRAETRLRILMRELATHGIEVFMVHGNHDPLDGHKSHLTYGENVHVFGPTVEVHRFEKEGRPTASIYGFSYATQHVTENMIDSYEKRPGTDFHIAILHGSIKENTEHDVYAPFTISNLLNKEMDYWALGHIHKREILNQDPPVIYPGSLQGLSIKETGEKGFYIVALDGKKAHTEYVRTNDIFWKMINIDVSEFETFDSLVQKVEELKEMARERAEGVLLRINMVGDSGLSEEVRTEDLIEILRTGEEDRRDFVWVMDIKDDTTPAFNREKLKESPHFMGDIVRLIDQRESIKEDLKALYQHHEAKKFLPLLSDEEQSLILKDAEKLLLSRLMSTGQHTK